MHKTNIVVTRGQFDRFSSGINLHLTSTTFWESPTLYSFSVGFMGVSWETFSEIIGVL